MDTSETYIRMSDCEIMELAKLLDEQSPPEEGWPLSMEQASKCLQDALLKLYETRGEVEE